MVKRILSIKLRSTNIICCLCDTILGNLKYKWDFNKTWLNIFQLTKDGFVLYVDLLFVCLLVLFCLCICFRICLLVGWFVKWVIHLFVHYFVCVCSIAWMEKCWYINPEVSGSSLGPSKIFKFACVCLLSFLTLMCSYVGLFVSQFVRWFSCLFFSLLVGFYWWSGLFVWTFL